MASSTDPQYILQSFIIKSHFHACYACEGPWDPTNTKARKDVLDQTNVAKLRARSSYLYTVEGDVTKNNQDDYCPIGIKECGIHQGNLMDIKR
jgi:hypothetical protein